VNCKGIIAIPQINPDLISESAIPLKQTEFAGNIKVSSGRTLCEVSSGEYVFRARLDKKK
jgi:hypothetical protein